MKKIEAIIRSEKLDDVKTALEKAGISGLTSCEVKGRGRQKGIRLTSRTGDYCVDMLPKTLIELVVSDAEADKAVGTIVSVVKTGSIGDGKIFVTSVEEVIRVRTGERGDAAV